MEYQETPLQSSARRNCRSEAPIECGCVKDGSISVHGTSRMGPTHVFAELIQTSGVVAAALRLAVVDRRSGVVVIGDVALQIGFAGEGAQVAAGYAGANVKMLGIFQPPELERKKKLTRRPFCGGAGDQ